MKNGWQRKALGEIAEHSLGKMLDKVKNQGTPRPYLRNLNVRWFDFDLSDLAEMRFRDEEANKFTAKRGDVLICEGGYPGRAAVWDRDEPIHFQKAIHRVRFHEADRNRWFVYYLHYLDLTGELRDYFTGTGIQHFTGETLDRLPVPLPPLAEQRRIVAILDEAFAAIATAKANAEKKLANARAVFESQLYTVFAQRGDGWITRALADCLEQITYGFTNPMPTTTEGPYMVTARNVVGGRIAYESTRRTSQDAFDTLLTDKSRPQVGDVLLTKDGTLGRVAVVDRSDICINQSVALLRPNKRMTSHFMRHLLSSPEYQKRMIDNAGGTTIKHIYITRVDKMPVAFPECVEAQKHVVTNLDTLAAAIHRLESLAQQKLVWLNELKKSLLHQAFAGKLGSRDAVKMMSM